jgi:WhiB family redox-sensing transcriptional regulator
VATKSPIRPAQVTAALIDIRFLRALAVRKYGSEHEKDWRDYALCQTLPADEMTPTVDGVYVAKYQKRAQRHCVSCPVMAECLAEALDNEEEFFVWGGTTEAERPPMVLAWRDLRAHGRRRRGRRMVNA